MSCEPMPAPAARPPFFRHLSRAAPVALAALAMLALVLSPPVARAGEMRTMAAPAELPDGASSVLDGRTFHGRIGHAGEEAFAEDEWMFEDGSFMSEKCIECGYANSPYWVRFEQDGVRFLSESKCPVTDATIVWQGVVTGDRIEGTFTWTKERWYWTVEREFWFSGRLVDRDVAMTDER